MSDKIEIKIGDRIVAADLGQSVLEIALANGIALDHACGAVCACSTCHVKILSGAQAFSEPSEEEEDRLDGARGVELTSRLGCQARLERKPDGPIEVVIPAWNVNLVREGHG